MPSRSTNQAFLGPLARLSRRLGTDIERTQGAGGNTSLKAEGILWVKASGTWLAEAESRAIFVPVRTDPLLAALRDGDERAEKATAFVVDEDNPGGLRPSIETAVHAVMPQGVVLHIHCVHTIAHAVRKDFETRVRQRLRTAGLAERLGFVPYCRPGVPLAREMVRLVPDRPDVVVLGNHGLVVAGADVEEAAARLERVVAALRLERRRPPAADLAALQRLAEGTVYRLPADPESHDTALDATALAAARAGPLYPDHVIFLGEAPGELREGESLAAFVHRHEAKGRPLPRLVLVPGAGCLVHVSLTAGGEALVRCLAEVTCRLDTEDGLRVLTPSECHALTNWEAEKYRQALDRPAAGERP
ncbi:class II aldolase/adducin family protein [Jiella sonneratiae]|uniref:Class II aldolase n=1 Tax=Jiella sonneratiae TaxID=2816856 RepID=A0ABS3IYF7_9HYPH|nr:class II aldolase/adducin family protein [Jiella sonneratiae]MBO0902447.1 class II aldolase [Jiella sonneratiae]